MVPSPAPQNKQPKTRKETEPLETQNIKYQSRKKGVYCWREENKPTVTYSFLVMKGNLFLTSDSRVS